MKMSSAPQVLTHRNPTHATDSFSRLSKLRREGILCDLTILVQGHKFKAHKAIMAACSDYFLTAICGGKSTASVSVSNGSSGSHMTIELQYVTMRGFAPLLEYAYTSDLNVSATDVIDVLSAASYMQMFDVANACSEFMRSNLLWSQNQSRLAGLSLLPGRRPLMLNGHNDDRGSASPNYGRSNGLPDAVTNLLQATSAISGSAGAGAPTLGRPPMLIPISSMNPYEVNLQQIADTMAAGTHNLISRLVNGQTHNAMNSSPSSVSPVASSRNSPSTNWTQENRPSSLQHPSAPERPVSSEITRSEGASPRTKEEADAPSQEQDMPENLANNNNNNNNNNNSNLSDAENNNDTSRNRNAVAVKVETPSDDEINAIAPPTKDRLPQESFSGDAEDSWQSLQRLYSFSKPEINALSPGKSPVSGNIDGSNAAMQRNTLSPSLINRIATSNGMKMALDKYKDSLPKLENGISMVPPTLNGLSSVHRALLQQQLLAQQQQQQQQMSKTQPRADGEKMIPELPAVPPGGQYMSVRRRTLQSNVPKPHQCQICGSRFTRFHNLKQHIKLHSGIKPYECDECGKRFTRNYTLRLHKMKHVGLRNFRCGTCDAAFTSLGEFRAHLRITMHSHLPANSNKGSPVPQNRMLEPEDLSNGQMPGVPVKFAGQFDCSMLRYGVESPGSSVGRTGGEGSTGTISPPGNPSDGHLMSGMESPQMSDQSFSASPQDLSAKRPLSEDDELQDSDEINKRPRSDCDSSPYKDDEPNEPMSLVIDQGQGVLAEGSN